MGHYRNCNNNNNDDNNTNVRAHAPAQKLICAIDKKYKLSAINKRRTRIVDISSTNGAFQSSLFSRSWMLEREKRLLPHQVQTLHLFNCNFNAICWMCFLLAHLLCAHVKVFNTHIFENKDGKAAINWREFQKLARNCGGKKIPFSRHQEQNTATEID